MNIIKTRKNINHLKKIREIVEISKFDTLNKLQKDAEMINSFLKIGVYAKNMIEFATKKYWINSPLLMKKKSKKTIWIFLSIPSKSFPVSYSNQEKIIVESFDKINDSLIVIGQPAINFANKFEVNPIFLEKNIDLALEEIPELVASISKDKNKPNVKFISNNSFSKNKPIDIIPINKFNLTIETEKINKKTVFFPSLPDVILALGEIYLQKITVALIRDSIHFYLKEKLIKHEESLKLIDEKISNKFRELNKLMRKSEMDELLLVTQISKRGVDE